MSTCKNDIITLVRGNEIHVALPLEQILITEESKVVTEFVPLPTDKVTVNIRDRKVYSYSPRIEGNVATFTIGANVACGVYGIEVLVARESGEHLRSFRLRQLAIVENNEQAGILPEKVEFDVNVVTLDNAVFLFAKGDKGDTGVGIESVECVESTESGGENRILVTLEDGRTSQFVVRNGGKGDKGDKMTYEDLTQADRDDLASHIDLSGYVTNADYDSVTKRIYFRHNNNILCYVDATEFIKDGMVESVTIVNGQLIVTFNTDAGQEDIVLDLADVFDPANYYTKAEVNNLLPLIIDIPSSGFIPNRTIKEIYDAYNGGRPVFMRYNNVFYLVTTATKSVYSEYYTVTAYGNPQSGDSVQQIYINTNMEYATFTTFQFANKSGSFSQNFAANTLSANSISLAGVDVASTLDSKAYLNGNGNEDFAAASLNASNVVFGGYATISGAAPTIQVSNTIGGSTVQFPYDRSGTLALTSDIPDVSGFAEKAFIVTVTDGAQPDTYVTDKTVAEIVSAVSAGRLCLLKYGDMIYQLAGDYTGYPVFAGASISGDEWLFWIVEPEGVFCSEIEWQPKLESGQSIKTINNTSLLGSGDLALATASQLSNYCPIIEDTRSSAVANITGVAPFATLVDGQRIILHMTNICPNNATLSLTLAGGATTTNIPIFTVHNRLLGYTSYAQMPVGTYLPLFYEQTSNRWVECGKDTDTTYNATTQAQIDAGTLTGAQLISPQLLCDNFDKVTTLVEVSSTGDVTQALESGKFYKFGSLDSLTITLTAASAGMGIWGGKFTASANWSALGLPATVDEAAGNDTIASGKTYEFNILDNVIVLKEV